MIRKYKQFLEANEFENKKSNISDEFKNEIKEMIDKTIEKSGGEFKSFVEKFIQEPNDTKIEGLINDSDLFDFYLKWRNDIDPILNDIRFFDESPNKVGVVGLYEYVVSGTNKSISEVVKSLTSSDSSDEPQ